MREMKDSDIEWVGVIPTDWDIQILKYQTEKYERGTAPDYTDEIMTKVVNQATFSKGYFDTSNIRYSSKDAKTSRGLLKKGDVLLASTGGGVLGKTYYFNEDDVYVADSHVTIVRTIDTLFSKYLYYYFSINYSTFNAVMAEGSTNQTELQRDLLGKMPIPFPPIEEQQAIAGYLDRKCVEIDALISDIQQQIETLEEYKKSLVFHVVSTGIKSTTLKETVSNVWTKIPQNWKLVDIKYVFEIVKRIAGQEGFDVLSVTQKGLKIKDIESNNGQQAESYSGYQFVYPADYVMNHMDLLTGWVDCSTMFGVTSPDYRVFRLCDKENNDLTYFKYVMQCCYMSRIFYSLGQGVSNLGRWRLQTSAFNNFMIPVPPFNEQKEIAKYLDKKISEIDTIIAEKKQQIKTIEEYKKSLIFEYVTGKKEVN